MAKVHVHVTYCNGCGYGSKYQRLKLDLIDIFGDKIDVDHYAEPGVTSEFEVYVNGQLVHSKKGGDGYVDSKTKFDKISDAIEAALND